MFVGVGAALAKAERDRRSDKQRRRERKLGLRRGEPVAAGLRRMALVQADLAIESLEGGRHTNRKGGGGAPNADAVHESRKALKRLRALLRLLGDDLGEQVYERENAALRDVGRRLAGVRDAEVMLTTLDTLVARHRGKLSDRPGVRRLRSALVTEQERMRRQTLGDPATLAVVLGELRAFRARAFAWSLSDRRGIELVQDDLKRLYGQGRRRRRRAAARDGRDMHAMHQWRKRVKDLRYGAEMLNRPGLARRADDLGETLGEDHDLAVLARLIEADTQGPAAQAHLGRGTRNLLGKLIAQRRRKLQRRALKEGKRLYRRKPKQFALRARKLSPR